MPSKVQLTGGAFQDSEGNVLNSGYLIMRLSQDGVISGVGQVCSGIDIKINLDSSGNVVASPAQSVWGNDQLSPVNSYYRVFGYTAQGLLAFGPNNQQVNGSGGTFNIGTWIPNTIISWTPPVSAPLLETNSTLNSRQDLLNITGAGGTSVGESGGLVTITSVGGATLETNGVPNSSQALLNLIGSGGVSVAESAGTVTIDGGSNSIAQSLEFSLRITTAPGPITQFTYVGANAAEAVTFGTAGFGGGSNTEFSSVTYPTTASASTTVFGHVLSKPGITPNFGRPFTRFTQFFGRGNLSSTSNIRAWIGMVGLAQFGASINSFAADNGGNMGIVAFRYSAGTDTHWQAVVNPLGGTPTVVDTGVTPDTSIHSFIVTYDGTSLKYYIDGALVATISSNLPSGATAMLAAACFADNKNSANNVNFAFEMLREKYTL